MAELLPEFGRRPDAVAIEKRDAELVARADAAVFVCVDREPGALWLLELMKLKGVPVLRRLSRTNPPPRARAVCSIWAGLCALPVEQFRRYGERGGRRSRE